MSVIRVVRQDVKMTYVARLEQRVEHVRRVGKNIRRKRVLVLHAARIRRARGTEHGHVRVVSASIGGTERERDARHRACGGAFLHLGNACCRRRGAAKVVRADVGGRRVQKGVVQSGDNQVVKFLGKRRLLGHPAQDGDCLGELEG